jgi:3-dehydroquinate synthase
MTIRVELGERSYDVLISPGALKTYAAPEWEQAAILSNTSVLPLYGEPMLAGRRAQNLASISHAAPEGEAAKNLEEVARAYDVLAAGGFSRRGVVVAVGGGVVGDWAGFVAATWMRGVDFVQIPTTLLAMVDSSVGGKTGVNHPRAKNLIGAFHQPKFVLIDPQVLATLPAREVRAGLAEVIKYGVIADWEFFEWLEANLDTLLALDPDAVAHAIARSVQVKADVVGQDERESDASGRRATLNYGHTLGHAVEAVADYGKYLHGEAIAIGMDFAARVAVRLGTISTGDGHELIQRQARLFERAGLPVRVPDGMRWEALRAAMALDKKGRDGELNFVLPTRLGHVETVRGVEEETLRAEFETQANA